MASILPVAVVLISLHAISCELDTCDIKMEPVGCYRDRPTPGNRAMDHHVMDLKSPKGSYKNAMELPELLPDWSNYAEWLEVFICECGKKAFYLGYKVIGIQFFRECWGSELGHEEYNKYGNTTSCVKTDYAPCSPGEKTCAGGYNTNYIYRIAPSRCDLYFEPVGCYNDYGRKPRLFPNYAMNERDYTLPNWNEKLIDWENWDVYSPEMICRCAHKAKTTSQEYFSMQFYGECWTGPSNQTQYYKEGQSDRCLAKGFHKANYHSYIAVGKDHANYIYRSITAPNA